MFIYAWSSGNANEIVAMAFDSWSGDYTDDYYLTSSLGSTRPGEIYIWVGGTGNGYGCNCTLQNFNLYYNYGAYISPLTFTDMMALSNGPSTWITISLC